MPRICFLTDSELSDRHDNALRIPRAFSRAGWDVSIGLHEQVCLAPTGVGILCGREWTRLSDFDQIWPMGLGPRPSFLDRMQILSLLPSQLFVNAPEALLLLHGKYHTSWGPLAAHQPETFASNNAAWLEQVIRSQPSVDWIIKPPAGSFGMGVHRTHASDPQLKDLLQYATLKDDTRYCLLQHYQPEFARGEKRVMLANGTILGTYLRSPQSVSPSSESSQVTCTGEIRLNNLSAGGDAQAVNLTRHERKLVTEVSAYLAQHACHFAAVDLCYPYIVEINVANPGGLETLEHLYGEDFARAIPGALLPLLSLC